MTARSVNHATFVIERTYPAAPGRVFAAWASLEAKNIWMDDPDYKSDGTEGQLDFRVGGHERFGGLSPEGSTYRYDATYYDIVPDQRIVYCYEMYAGEARISVSVATVEFRGQDMSTHLVLTEQGVFLDGHDTVAQRKEGTRSLLDSLAAILPGGAA